MIEIFCWYSNQGTRYSTRYSTRYKLWISNSWQVNCSFIQLYLITSSKLHPFHLLLLCLLQIPKMFQTVYEYLQQHWLTYSLLKGSRERKLLLFCEIRKKCGSDWGSKLPQNLAKFRRNYFCCTVFSSKLNTPNISKKYFWKFLGSQLGNHKIDTAETETGIVWCLGGFGTDAGVDSIQHLFRIIISLQAINSDICQYREYCRRVEWWGRI
jgi:hypothetical protein